MGRGASKECDEQQTDTIQTQPLERRRVGQKLLLGEELSKVLLARGLSSMQVPQLCQLLLGILWGHVQVILQGIVQELVRDLVRELVQDLVRNGARQLEVLTSPVRCLQNGSARIISCSGGKTIPCLDEYESMQICNIQYITLISVYTHDNNKPSCSPLEITILRVILSIFTSCKLIFIYNVDCWLF